MTEICSIAVIYGDRVYGDRTTCQSYDFFVLSPRRKERKDFLLGLFKSINGMGKAISLFFLFGFHSYSWRSLRLCEIHFLVRVSHFRQIPSGPEESTMESIFMVTLSAILNMVKVGNSSTAQTIAIFNAKRSFETLQKATLCRYSEHLPTFHLSQNMNCCRVI